MPAITQEEQIIENENRLLEALKTGNLNVLDEMLHDNLLFNIPTGQTITKAIDLENYRSGTLMISEITSTDRVVSSIDNTLSVVAVTLHLKGSYAGHTINDNFRYLRVWKLFGTTWKVIGGSGVHL